MITYLKACLIIIFLSMISQHALASTNESEEISMPCFMDSTSTSLETSIDEELPPYFDGSIPVNSQDSRALSAPRKPSVRGPSDSLIRQGVIFYANTLNQGGGRIQYIFEFWDDGQPSYKRTGFVAPDREVEMSNVWRHCGKGLVRVRAVDEGGSSSEWSEVKDIMIWTVPSTPERPSGPRNVKKGVQYNYCARSTDSCGNLIKYEFDFGKGGRDQLYYWRSGACASESWIWNSPGSYNVKVRATNLQGKSSAWSPSLTVTVR